MTMLAFEHHQLTGLGDPMDGRNVQQTVTAFPAPLNWFYKPVHGQTQRPNHATLTDGNK
jgi:hypothetical protein